MNWNTLLTTLDANGERMSPGERFSRDCDTLTFSKEYRRLCGITQVFSLSPSQAIRNRQTHTNEVAALARWLGYNVARELLPRYDVPDLHRSHVGMLLQAAGMAHDLGHPPLAHSGEESIRDWMRTSTVAEALLSPLTPSQRKEFENFEGNAQNYRLIQQLDDTLSYATLATFGKYLRPADFVTPDDVASGYIGFKKYGYFESEKGLITNMAEACGLTEVSRGVWLRHPLAYLLEAADDICYRLVDMEDAATMGIEPDVVEQLLRSVAAPGLVLNEPSRMKRIRMLRASALKRIAHEAVAVFLDAESSMRNGTFMGDILDHIPHSVEMRALTQFAHERIYVDPKAAEIRAAGFGVLEGLLNYFGSALLDIYQNRGNARHKSNSAIRLMGDMCTIDSIVTLNPYELAHLLTDFVGGSTDREAVILFQRISGQSLPIA